MSKWIKICLGRFPTIQKIFVSIPSSHLLSPDPRRRDRTRASALFGLEQHLGVRPVPACVPSGEWELWFVEATKDQTLKWNEGQIFSVLEV